MSLPRPARRRWPRVLAAIALALALVIAGFAVWSAVASAPAGEPQAVEFADATISDDLASATVLALGEATHGTAEFQHARLTLLQKLVDRGFTTIALEDPAGTSSEVDAWLQGGSGTVTDAVSAFGYRLYRTQETADLLSWIRAHNEGCPEAERIRLYGIDIQRPDADKRIVLGWLATLDPDAAARFTSQLAGLTDDSRRDRGVVDTALPPARALAEAVEAAAEGRADDASLRARLSARALVAGLEGALPGSVPSDRDVRMADLLALLVAERSAAGGAHTLLFGHNGHLDKAGQATGVPGPSLGSLSAERWGGAYRAIGTDGHHVAFADQGETFSVRVDSPIRGLFAGTTQGYLEWSAASERNRAVLDRALPMVSTGTPFAPWQAWVPFFHSVTVTPAQAWDATIYVEDAHPSTTLR